MAHVFKPENMGRLDGEERRKLIPPERVLDMMQIKKGDSLLDIGAGTGYFAIPALARVGGAGRVIAADISKEMLDELKKRAPGGALNLDILLCGPDTIPLPDKTADRVLLAFVLHEIEDQKAYLVEVRRLLKDNGELTVVEWDTVESPMGPPLEERLGSRQLVSLSEDAGLSAVKYVNINEYQYLYIFRKA